MNSIGLLSNDIDLANAFKTSSRFDRVELLTKENLTQNRHDMLIISDRIIGFLELKNIAHTLESKKCFYMVSNENFTNLSEALVGSTGIIMVPPRLTTEQVFNFVYQKLERNLISKNKVFTFFGADSKVGTTMVSQSVATIMTKVSDRVLYLPLDGNVGDDYIEFESRFGLGELKARLQTKILSHSELMDICIKTKSGFFVLPGLKNMLLKRSFHPEDIVYLIELLQNSYDLVIIDAGSDVELGMTVAALNYTPNRFLVTTQQSLTHKRYDRLKSQVLDKLCIDRFLLVINKRFEMSALDDQSILENTYDASAVSILPFLEYGWQCEQERTTLLSYKNDEYIRGIEEIANVISSHVGIKWIHTLKKKKGLIQKLFGSKKDVESYDTAL